MANISWVTQRREDVSHILVDSIQKLGNANSLSFNTFNQVQDRHNIAVQTCHLPSPSNSNHQNLTSNDNIVPLLDLELLQRQSEGCKSLGYLCQYVCVNCGKPVLESHSSDAMSVSVLSPKMSNFSITKADKPISTEPESSTKTYESSENFILQSLGLGNNINKNEEEDKDGTGKKSVMSICLAEPEDWPKSVEEKSSDDSIEKMVVPPITLTHLHKAPAPSPSPTTLTHLHKAPSPPKKEPLALQDCAIEIEKEAEVAPAGPTNKSSSTDSRYNKDRRRSFGFNLKPSPEELSAAMPRMYRNRSTRKKQSSLDRLLGVLGLIRKKKKNKPFGHFS